MLPDQTLIDTFFSFNSLTMAVKIPSAIPVMLEVVVVDLRRVIVAAVAVMMKSGNASLLLSLMFLSRSLLMLTLENHSVNGACHVRRCLASFPCCYCCSRMQCIRF